MGSKAGRLPAGLRFTRNKYRREAEDVVQDAFLHLLQRGTAATLAQPRAYLFCTAANVAVDFARKAKIRLRHAGESFDLGADALAPANPEAAQVPRWSLPGFMIRFPNCRHLAVMSFCSIASRD
jgi:DNA-directed RNA polymerase specialized sigma24 family protein